MATSADAGSPAGADRRPGRPVDGRQDELLAPRRRPAPGTRWRAALSALLIALTSLLAPVSVVSVWAADEMGDADRYVATVAPLARDPAIRAAVSDRVTEALMTKIDLNTLLAAAASPAERPALVSALGSFDPKVSGGVRDLVRATVARLVASDYFARTWAQLNRQAHAAFTGARSGQSGAAVRVKADAVLIDLAPVVQQAKMRLVDQGLSAAARIPEVRATYTLVRPEDVRRVRTGVRALRIAGAWLPVVTLVLAGTGVLAATRRRRALVAAGLAVAASVAVLGVGLAVFRIIYLNYLPFRLDDEAAGAVYDQLVRFLWVTVRMVITLGVVVAVGGWLSGHGRRARRIRDVGKSTITAARRTARITSLGAAGQWVRRHRMALRWVVVTVAGGTVSAWPYPTAMVIVWIAVAVVAALAVVEFLGVERQPGAAGVTSA